MSFISPSVTLRGVLDTSAAPRVRLALDRLSGPGLVDMRDVTFIDSATLTELVRLAKRAGRREITLVVAAPHVRRILAIVGFDELFTIVSDRRGPSAAAGD